MSDTPPQDPIAPPEDAAEIPAGFIEGMLPDPRDQQIIQLKEEAGTLKEQVLRLAAELSNLRKRAEREKAEATLYAASNFARDLLSVADNFGRALQSVPVAMRHTLDEAMQNFIGGIEVTGRELANVFQRHGIKRQEPLGQRFDPNMHQALFEVPTNDDLPGTVVQVIQAGYVVGTRCLRPALVGVAAEAPPAGPEPQNLNV